MGDPSAFNVAMLGTDPCQGGLGVEFLPEPDAVAPLTRLEGNGGDQRRNSLG
jgi:hypothetical protein